MVDTAQNLNDRFQRFVNGIGDRYEPYIRQHLSKVYMVLASTTAAAAGGALLQMKNYIDLGMLAAIASLVLVLGLHFYRDDGKNYYTRLGMLYAFGFCSGQTLGPLLGYIVSINPAIILTALTGTFVTFASLSLAALLAEQGKYLYLGGMLVSVINCMALLSLFNMIFKSYFVQITQLYVGVFVMAAFIVYDTQNIVEKCRLGNRDVVQHALDLFFDVLSMFRRLLIILTQKEEQKQADRRKRK
ncbi:bax inhibitor 1 [Drosophila sulfurigaster albostrigata]|uniref:Bax inhibitor 1 n=1 Tax=Drosophila albomicans TaxID=7291 RepID=A0A6P8X313_DROAB|nr:bax inhibitor 1 [Drosophila albomicans]XP_060651963.1 bax inhibitor 1 [Drosophila nasuta]XP_062129751.1 bax inhibitor 1 [Drosophila sulfurigaster albostrigata]